MDVGVSSIDCSSGFGEHGIDCVGVDRVNLFQFN